VSATILNDLPNADYHADEAVGSSGLKLIAQSPLHFWSAYRDPDRKQRTVSRQFMIGTAWHTAIFEPARFGIEYAADHGISGASTLGKLVNTALADMETFLDTHVAIPDGLGKTTKEGKALLAELATAGKTGVEEAVLAQVLEAAKPLIGKTLLSADDLSDVERMAAAARNHPAVRVIFSQAGGVAEQSIFWTDAPTGVRCKIRPDYHVPPCELFPYGLIVDGKSTNDASADGFAKSVWNYDYPMQAAYYSDGYQIAYGTDQPPAFLWLAQEKDAPFATAVYSCSADLIAFGRKQYRRQLELLSVCQDLNQWPGYPTEVVDLAMPGWADKIIEDSIGEKA